MSGIRGYLFTIITYSESKQRSLFFHEIVHRLIEKFPSRVLFIEIDTRFQELTTTKKTSQDLGCEQITIQAPPTMQNRIPSLLLSLLLPDLPIYFVWGQDPSSDHPILNELLKLSDRYVYDPEMAPSPLSFAKKMKDKIRSLEVEWMDIEWAKTRGWRDTIAETFDVPSRLQHVRDTQQITIKANKVGCQALYLQGWLAAMLNWTPKACVKKGDQIDIDYAEQKVLLCRYPRPDLSSHSVYEVEVLTHSGLKYTFSLQENQRKIFTYFSTQTECELPEVHTIPDLEKGFSFMKEIFYLKTSTHYQKMLALLGQIAEEKN